MNNLSWDEYYINMLDSIASKSKDPRTKVGCFIVDSKDYSIKISGFNGFAIGVKDLPERYNDRVLKNLMISHAEANAISLAAKHGTSLNNSFIYLPWYPCPTCSNMIRNSGIRKVIIDARDYNKKIEHWKDWSERMEISKLILSEGQDPVEVKLFGKEGINV